jgi:hypothetical protein
MAQACKALHLAKHEVAGRASENGKAGEGVSVAHCAADVVGLVGQESDYYVINLDRWAPPESPMDTRHLPPTPANSVYSRKVKKLFG